MTTNTVRDRGQRSASSKETADWTLTQAQLSPTLTESRRYQHRTLCSDQTHCTHCSSAPRPKLLQAPLFTTDAVGRRPALASPSATRRAKRMLALVAERRGECCLAPDLCFCHVTAATVGRTPRQPERRRRHIQPIVTRAGCEGARESRGSHAASLNKGFGGVHMDNIHSLSLGFLPREFSQGGRAARRGPNAVRPDRPTETPSDTHISIAAKHGPSDRRKESNIEDGGGGRRGAWRAWSACHGPR